MSEAAVRERPLVVALMGPTASGKTALAIELAQRYGLAPDDRLGIKEAATRELIAFVEQVPSTPSQAARPGKPAKGGSIKTTEQPPPPHKGKGKGKSGH